MKSVNINKAQKVATEIPSVCIVIDETLPECRTQEMAIEFYEHDADRLAEVLCNSLPGGTLDRLTVKLLQKKTTSLIVPLFRE